MVPNSADCECKHSGTIRKANSNQSYTPSIIQSLPAILLYPTSMVALSVDSTDQQQAEMKADLKAGE